MARRDYYVLLGVKPSASKAEIRRAFQKLARKFHPDINPGDNVAALRYQRIAEAFEVLMDPDRRERYDMVGVATETERRPEPARYGFEGFDFTLSGAREADIFPELFRPRSSPSEGGPKDGEDVHHRLSISFEESLQGAVRTIAIGRHVACEECDGWGEVPVTEARACPFCKGRGRATQARGFMLFTRPCGPCGGSGTVTRERCSACAGAGRTSASHEVSIEIPKGVADGDRLSLPGMGNHGRGTGRSGDLYVHVEVRPHAMFAREGENLFCRVPISFREAALGAKIKVPTPEGRVTLRVPAGVQSGQKLRLSGRGAPSRRSPTGKGDLFVQVQVVTPDVVDDRSRVLLEELDQLNPVESRSPIEISPDEVESKR